MGFTYSVALQSVLDNMYSKTTQKFVFELKVLDSSAYISQI